MNRRIFPLHQNKQNAYRATPDGACRPALGFIDRLAILDEISRLCDSLHSDRDIAEIFLKPLRDVYKLIQTCSIALDVADDILNPKVLRLARLR